MNGFWPISLTAALGIAFVQGLVLVALHARAGRLLFEQSSRYKVLTTEDGPPLDSPLPPLKGRDARTHEPVAAAQFRGQPLVILFVSPDCDTCEELLQAVRARRRGWEEAVNVLVVVQAAEEEAVAYTSGLPDLPVLADPDGHLSRSCQVERVPLGLMVNAWGYVRMKGVVNNLAQLLGLIAGQGKSIAGLSWIRADGAEPAGPATER
jgi:hypothetical protein